MPDEDPVARMEQYIKDLQRDYIQNLAMLLDQQIMMDTAIDYGQYVSHDESTPLSRLEETVRKFRQKHGSPEDKVLALHPQTWAAVQQTVHFTPDPDYRKYHRIYGMDVIVSDKLPKDEAFVVRRDLIGYVWRGDISPKPITEWPEMPEWVPVAAWKLYLLLLLIFVIIILLVR